MARIPYPDVSEPPLADLAAHIRAERGGRLPNLFLMHLHNPAVLEAWLALGTALRYRTTLDQRSLELTVCYVSRLLDYDYQWNAHAPLALAAGIDPAALEELPRWRDVPGFDDRDRLVLAYVEAVSAATEIGDDVFVALRAEFTDQQVMELTATAAFYGCGARFLKALDVRNDE